MQFYLKHAVGNRERWKTRGTLSHASGVIIAEDKISSLKRFKDDVREVAQSFECGIGLERFNDIKVGDVFEAYIMEEVAK